MKLQLDTYNRLIDLLVTEANNTEDETERQELDDMMAELDTIGTY